ncbi:MAG: DUF1156 domain-containing protein [Myxococcales bacterium]|nr:DUF1156 domain-containing protein [Myxococcales bacterium]
MRRLIEEAFPLKKVSEDSKHEKSAGRKGHISTLHIWPARRPLAASRAAVIATLLPDPADAPAEVKKAYTELAGSPDPVRQREDLCKRIEKVTRWNGVDQAELERLRGLIKLAYGGEAPTVMDIFSGGGAIPLEAMRMGAKAIAIEYNPVAWFILKCTLEFPSKLAGKTWPLPDDGKKKEQLLKGMAPRVGDLAAQVRYWGGWVHEHVEKELAPYFPRPDGKSPIAYFWARTVPCQDPKCGATVPLIKTLWLCTKKGKERALRLKPNAKKRRVEFEVFSPSNKNEVGAGTVANAKAFCPFHDQPLPLTAQYIKNCGKAGKMGAQLTAVCVEGKSGKEYRNATPEETEAATKAERDMPALMAQLPGGPLHEPLVEVRPAPNTRGVSSLARFGIVHFGQVFAPRQQLALGVIAKWTRAAFKEVQRTSGDTVLADTVLAYLYCALVKVADRNSSIATWDVGFQKIRTSFAKFALPMTWDFCEAQPTSDSSGGYPGAIARTTDVLDHLCTAAIGPADVHLTSATKLEGIADVDAIVTDPPYYGAIPYADLADFFYVWLRRAVGDRYPVVFDGEEVVPRSEELVQHAAYTNGDHAAAKRRYEEGMGTAFSKAARTLSKDGVMVVVFANKEPDAWDALVTSLVNAGCTVTGSWPIDTELATKMGAMKAAYLATSVWLVCRPRPENAGIGRYSEVQKRMQERIAERLRYFWDLGVSGPDFVWAAVGPALEAYSQFREVRRIDGSAFTVKEFLREVRRLVTDFALGQILHGASTEGLDEWTRYYMMHRSSFGLEPAPAGECILLSQGYNLDLNELRGGRGILAKGKKAKVAEDGETDDDEGGGSGSDLRLLAWDERKHDDLGLPHASGGLPLIDALHRMMHLWSAGDTNRLKDYADEQGLKQNELFWTVAQAVLETSDPKSRERTLLEALVAWGRGKEARSTKPAQPTLFGGENNR